ncbi:MAG: SusD/RagB family nutrient-binding outer membrane lipoprotein [Bacteroidetes bacterium]|nr:SusD/RagB family nutrient-binding outer membrane lipoprotein [Bacteroidota bacterium]
MKNINIKLIGLVFLMALALGSCKKWINTDLNVNPDAPSDVPMGSILTGVQANMAYNTIGGNDLCRVTSIWMQYFQGIARQSQSTANYYLLPSDINNLWVTNYTNTMMNLQTIIAKATSAGNPTYRGIADVLMANSIGITTDFWGSIPLSGAFQGVANLTPTFDAQEAVYIEIIRYLDDAIVELSMEGAPSVDGDVMYGGDPALWLQAAHSLKARYILHKSKLDANTWTQALAALGGAISSNANDLEFTFFDAAGSQNPLYQFMQQRGDITMAKVFIDTLNLVRHDPRLPMFATAVGDTAFVGNGWGEVSGDVSMPGNAVAAAASVVPFVTFVETLFMQAECLYKTNAPVEQVRAALIAAVTASMEKWGADYTAWMAIYTQYINFASGAPLYKEIMTQKWIALYNQAEAFNDWRRTDNVIGLQANPLTSAQQNVIPRHYPEAQSETNYNPNTPPDINLWSRVWWDAQAPTK